MHEASVVHIWVRCFKLFLLTIGNYEIHVQSFGPADVFLKDVYIICICKHDSCKAQPTTSIPLKSNNEKIKDCRL